MAVNTQKLLPGSKGGALAIRSSRKTISVERGEGGSLSKEILQMKIKIIRLQGEIQKNTKQSQKEEELTRRKTEKEKSSKREKQFERKDGFKGINLPNVISKLPGGSIVDTIKRFLGFTLLGWLVGKYDILMPQLEKFMAFAKPVFDTTVSLTTSLFKGVYGFVEAGYKAYDTVSAGIKAIGGENAEKTFNEFSGHLNKLLNGTLIAAMLIASTSPNGKTPPGKGAGYKAGFAAGFAAGLASRGSGGRYRSPGQAAAGGTLQENMQRQALTRQRMLEPSGPRGPLDRIGRGIRGAGAQLQTGTLFRRGAGAQKALYNLPGKVKGIVPKGIGGAGAGRIPIIGPLLTFGIRTLVYGEKPQKAAAAAIGMGLGQAVGTFIGTLGAGALGLGTAGIGAVVAPLIVGAGSVIGGLVGEWIGAALYDFIAGLGNKGQATGQARGGTVGTTRRRPRRVSTGPTPTRKKVRPQETKPGKDVGGRKKIETFYGTDKPRNSIKTRGELIVNSLEKTSKDVKKLPLDWIASIGGAYIDMTMGQKPEKKLASDVGKSFGSFIESAINTEVAATTSQITNTLIGMANGGSVPASSLERGQVAKTAAKNIEQRLQAIFDQSSTIALRNFKDQYSVLGTGDGFTISPDGAPPGDGPSATSEEQREAFEKIRKIAEKLGSPNPEVTAAIAMWETGWLANPNSVYFASGKTNPFGQTGSGPKGSVTGKDGQQHAVYNNIEEGVKAHLDLWKDAYKGKTAAEIIESIRQGGGRGMYNTNPTWSTNILNTLQSATMPVSKVEALSTGFRTGLRTGPAGRIGAGTEYHIDGRFMYNVPLKDKIAMLDSMAAAHAQEGYVMEFSGAGVAGMRWNPGMSQKEKEEFAKRVLTSHHANRHPWQAFDYFIVKRTAKDRFDKSAEGANVMAPLIRDGTYEYQEGGGGGRFLIIRDKNGKEVMRILHGDTGIPRPKELGKVFKMNELSEAQAQLAKSNDPNLPGQQPGQTRQASITQALVDKGAIPFTHNGQKFFFRVNPNGSVEAFKPKNALGYQEFVDIGGNKNKGLRDAINAKVQSMYGKPRPPKSGPQRSGYGGNMQKGGILGPYSSLNSIKEDTSYNKEMVVMYKEKIVMVPSQQY